jgi:hypothetical protein
MSFRKGRNFEKLRFAGKPTTDIDRIEFYRAVPGPRDKPPKRSKDELRAEAEKAFKDWKEKS